VNVQKVSIYATDMLRLQGMITVTVRRATGHHEQLRTMPERNRNASVAIFREYVTRALESIASSVQIYIAMVYV